MKIVFRVDASTDIGVGHVMRCLSIAQLLQSQGSSCSFICRDHPGNLVEYIGAQGFKVFTLGNVELSFDKNSEQDTNLRHSSWLHVNWKTDARQVRTLLQGQAVDWLIVDHYGLDVRWESRMRPLCGKIFVIDDLADRKHDCDLLLDQNYQRSQVSRYAELTPSSCVHLIGPEFSLLGAEYRALHPLVRFRSGKISRVLVYFGGADVGNITGSVLRALIECWRDRVQVDLVVDPRHHDLNSLQEMAAGQSNIQLHVGIRTLSKLIIRADLAIGAAGTTSWERCCLGLPALVISIAENQKIVAKELHAGGFIKWLGHGNDLTVDQIGRSIGQFLEMEISESWSRQCWNLVDGRGVERVGLFLSAGPGTQLSARPVKMIDEGLIFDWVNDPEVRKNAACSAEISIGEHNKWFQNLIKSYEDHRLYIIEGPSNYPVGQVRFDRVSDGWELTYSLDHRFRSRGLGANLLRTGIKKFKHEADKTSLIGKVRIKNIYSRKVFEALGFYEVEKDKEFITYMLH